MNEVKLRIPLKESDVRALKAGDRVLLTGRIVTARDRAHRYLAEEAKAADLPFDLSGGVLFHCGPVVQTLADGSWRLLAAGPTTSERMNAYVPALLKKFGVRAVIGKGGMGPGVLKALEESGAVYLSAVGGAAQVLAARVEAIECAFKTEEFGSAEGMWVMRVKDFPAVVTMDAKGHSLHEEVEAASGRRVKSLRDAK